LRIIGQGCNPTNHPLLLFIQLCFYNSPGGGNALNVKPDNGPVDLFAPACVILKISWKLGFETERGYKSNYINPVADKTTLI
jgi:hypothetical protein